MLTLNEAEMKEDAALMVKLISAAAHTYKQTLCETVFELGKRGDYPQVRFVNVVLSSLSAFCAGEILDLAVSYDHIEKHKHVESLINVVDFKLREIAAQAIPEMASVLKGNLSQH